jgi:hypothetical protein
MGGALQTYRNLLVRRYTGGVRPLNGRDDLVQSWRQAAPGTHRPAQRPKKAPQQLWTIRYRPNIGGLLNSEKHFFSRCFSLLCLKKSLKIKKPKNDVG